MRTRSKLLDVGSWARRLTFWTRGGSLTTTPVKKGFYGLPTRRFFRWPPGLGPESRILYRFPVFFPESWPAALFPFHRSARYLLE